MTTDTATRSEHSVPTLVVHLLSGWIVLGPLAAVATGVYVFVLAQGSGLSVFQSLPAWAYLVIASLAFLPFLPLVAVPTQVGGMLLAPLVVGLSYSAVAGLAGHLTKLQGYSDTAWLLTLILAGTVLWMWSYYDSFQHEAKEDAEGFDSFGRQHFPADAWHSQVDDQDTDQASEPPPAAPSHHQPQAEAAPLYAFERTFPRSGLAGLAGMAELKAEIHSAVAVFRHYGQGGAVADRNGILLSGPPGNGKTAFAKAIAGELGLPLIKVGVQDLTSKWVNESAAVIRELFRQASQRPVVLFFDEFDAVAASRGGDSGSAEDRKVVNALLAEIDKARAQRIVLIAATNFPEDLDPAIVRDGRFDFRIEIPYPDEEARAAVLSGLLRKFRLNAHPATVRQVAQLWERRSVAFIEATVKRLRDEGQYTTRAVTVEDFKRAARAASRRASAIPSAGERLSELALAAEVRQRVDPLLARLRNWESVAAHGGEPPTGILLSGPPGTGKTSFVRALARELGDWHVFEVNAAEVLARPRRFRELVEEAANHRPAFVFIDEADELLRDRRHSANPTITNEILKTMDGMMGKVPEVVFIAATNHAEAIDAAARRGGRFGEEIRMPRLRGSDLVAFFEKLLDQRRQVRRARDVTALTLAREFGEISPADAKAVFSQAVNGTFAEDGPRPITLEDIRWARRSMAARDDRGGTC